MDRKKFLITASLSALSVSTIGRALKSEDRFVGDCDTTDDILGPFYRPKAPTRWDLTSPGLVGSVVEIKGRVLSADCTTPLQNALVEIWHCNTEGAYDNESAGFHQRARWFTDEQGAYRFRTILPGKYLNGGKYRPAHIHFRVTADGNKELISQLYFRGDPHIEKDPWASKEKAQQRILPIVLEDTSGNLAVNFDIYISQK